MLRLAVFEAGPPGHPAEAPLWLCADPSTSGADACTLLALPFGSQVPVQLQSLSGKYATAAFTGALSQSEQTLKQVETDLQAINKLIEANDKSVVFFGASLLALLERAAPSY